MPVHTRFKDHAASRSSSHEHAEILRMSVIDTSLSQALALDVEHVMDAICLVIIDTDKHRHLL
jgi:hypothetical protein